MLSSITPLGERGRGQRWRVTATAYVVGSLLGGAVAGALAGAAGALVRLAVPGDRDVTTVLGLAAVVLAVAALADVRGWRLPPTRRQVDEDWLPRYRGWVYGFGFGVQLGLALTTIVTSAATYAFLGLAALTAAPSAGALVGALFGAARALPLLTLRTATHPRAVPVALARVARFAAPARRATVAGLAGLALLTAVLGAWTLSSDPSGGLS